MINLLQHYYAIVVLGCLFNSSSPIAVCVFPFTACFSSFNNPEVSTVWTLKIIPVSEAGSNKVWVLNMAPHSLQKPYTFKYVSVSVDSKTLPYLNT